MKTSQRGRTRRRLSRAILSRPVSSGRSRSGVALLIVLMVTAILTVVVLDFAESTRINFYIASNISDGMRAYYMAKSGVQVAEGALFKDSQNSKNDHLGEDWNNPMFSYIPLSDKEMISVQITDETGKFNLNALVTTTGRVNQFNLDVFKKLLENLSIDVTIANAIVDWIDKDEEAIEGGGAENDFYGYSSAQPEPYYAKNAKFLSLAEMKLVKGVTDDIYNKLADLSTIYSDGKYNINTMNDNVFLALVQNINADADAQGALTKIKKYRDEESNYFESKKIKQQLIDLGVEQQLVGRLSRYLTTSSRYFSVDVTANVGATVKSVHAVIQRARKKVKLVYYRPGERMRPVSIPSGISAQGGLAGMAGLFQGSGESE